MDFSKFKAKAIEFKNKAVELKNKTITTTAKKISESSLVIKTTKDLEDFILKSENKDFTTKEGEQKTFIKRVLVIFGSSKQNFFKELIINLPILLTKAFSQSLSLKIVDVENIEINFSIYELKEFPAMIVFENKEVYKTISGEEKLKKVVNSLTLDINKTIEEL